MIHVYATFWLVLSAWVVGEKVYDATGGNWWAVVVCLALWFGGFIACAAAIDEGGPS